ncbi:hypothetical protein EX30DRAFT_340477 [Ascodesmis nigricans]|uniref:Uncharacterized protein n=1 Tax=Ascodesmis nigricans TaxID=341454 RepID=A0A4S2MXZ5_9PEZI|nr:hypothetical protein EX30DRAFT_340477 [Ascodesmis nigricans]
MARRRTRRRRSVDDPSNDSYLSLWGVRHRCRRRGDSVQVFTQILPPFSLVRPFSLPSSSSAAGDRGSAGTAMIVLLPFVVRGRAVHGNSSSGLSLLSLSLLALFVLFLAMMVAAAAAVMEVEVEARWRMTRGGEKYVCVAVSPEAV